MTFTMYTPEDRLKLIAQLAYYCMIAAQQHRSADIFEMCDRINLLATKDDFFVRNNWDQLTKGLS
jgi:hypothetical protein